MHTITPKTTPVARAARLRALAAATAAAAVCLTAVAGCGTSGSSSSDASASAKASAKAAATPAAAVTVKDPWVKATDSAMTGVFGTLVNTTGSKVTVVSATSTAAKKTELHEVADVDGKMVMRPKEGGFTVPARGTHQLQPGADHLMLMGLAKEVKPGDEVTVTLTFEDGRSLRFTAVAKAFAGGKENYSPGMKKG
ncbi:copper chaperone PCu(A)C [Streptomyces sp. NPDC000987]|uniref:copper chaperone PCu(A)C n=1 Tax=Streptomyces sp. NPDC000987 TaxID=3154374 RepID=UPI00331A5933